MKEFFGYNVVVPCCFTPQEQFFPDLCHFPDHLPVLEGRHDDSTADFATDGDFSDNMLSFPSFDTFDAFEGLEELHNSHFGHLPPVFRPRPAGSNAQVGIVQNAIDLSDRAVIEESEPLLDWACLNSSWDYLEVPGPIGYLSTASSATLGLPGLIDSGFSSSQTTTASPEPQDSSHLAKCFMPKEIASDSSRLQQPLSQSESSTPSQPLRCRWGTCTTVCHRITDLR